MRGFTDYKIDVVIKFGGSILSNQVMCQKTIDSISQLARRGYRVMVIPGGGPTDNTIEDLDKKHPFHFNTHHRACARAQDQTGLMISDPVWNSEFVACETLEEVIKANDQFKVGVLLPSRLIFDLDPFERTWEITSDAMSVYFSWLVSAKHTVVLTNVDGVYKDGDIGNSEKLIKEITATDLEEMGHTAVDVCTPAFLRNRKMDCFVMNGQNSELILDYISNKDVVGTLIKGR
ncbi:MAG: aspartate kinase [Epsilonproteobacteria bacterium]|nr:aspartate kinase [Campylobacterota bacterium]